MGTPYGSSYGSPYGKGVEMKYKYRHRERYKDALLDVRAHSRKELMQKVLAKKEQIDKQTLDGDIRLRDFCKAYLETYKKHAVSESYYSDLCYFARKLVDGVGNKPIAKIRPMEVQAFLNSCNELSASTVRKIYDITHNVFEHAEKNGATSYTFDLQCPKGKKAVAGKSLTEEDQQALLHGIVGHRSELFIMIMYYCGLRPAEVSALTWADIDLKRNVLKVDKAVKKNNAIGQPKSLAGVREVPIPSTLSIRLKSTLKTAFFVCPQLKTDSHHTKSSLHKMWASLKAKIEAETGKPFNYRLYDIRHTYCTNLEKAGVPINIASRLMGHSDISITSKIYTHASDEAIEIARACIERAK